MRITIGSGGRFHAFELAEQVLKRGNLERFYCGFPKRRVEPAIASKADTFWTPFAPAWLASRVGASKLQNRLSSRAALRFDYWMAEHLRRCDIFHCLSGFGTHTHAVARTRFGAKTICDRGSSHIVEQNALLIEEYGRWRIPFGGIHQAAIDRELSEYDRCDRIFVPSSFALRTFLKRGVAASKLRQIPYGVDLDLFHPYPREDRKFRVVYAGVLSLRKGIPYLLEAMEPLSRYGIELWLIGRVLPEIVPFLKRYRGHYKLLGPQPRTNLPHLYSQASVFAISSIEEGLALVQVQAMACGLPVIGTPNSGAEDLVRDGEEGFVLPIRKPELLREKIRLLYENPQLLAQMRAAVLSKVRTLGGWDRYGSLVDSEYKTLLSN
jgi:glycosyltransferase involved in cell wall biosynthesis